ncbi:MAG: pentapeptide repeat-containing protein [Polyangiaceae bacterium]|nr:pentapeptide repeat-containing protein [Polyangiaceae bacterium]MCE7890601.1 pentapeptide repeat-containing protein [Sorangiineae bacterium PRO1]MCL4752135.1 pentapeptide repeat-containing protein [Myxococcales bacterium]
MAVSRKKLMKLLEESEVEGQDFSGSDFSGAEIQGGDFSESDLSGVNLAGANVSQAEFIGVNFSGARLDGARFSQCEFTDAVLAGVSVQGAVFEQCEFSVGVRRTLTGATFKMCDFGGDDDSDGGAMTAADAGAAPGQPDSAWKVYFRGFPDWEADERRYQAVEALFGSFAQSLPGSQVFRRVNDRKVEMRGTYASFPFRVELDLGGTSMFSMAAQMRPHVVASFCYEPDFVPEPQVHAWQHGETVRVFFGKGVFLEGHAGTTYVAAKSRRRATSTR